MKFKYLIIIFIMIIAMPTGVLAKGDVSISASNIKVSKGGNSSFVITANDSAGRIDIVSSNSKIVAVSEASVFLDMDSTTITVSGVSVGSAKITVYLYDVTTYDDDNLSGKSYTINVNVSESEKPKSNNNNLKSINVEGYDLEKLSDNEFELSVMNDVDSINIITALEDEKASVKGDGTQAINVGKNLIEVIVTSESGIENKYILNIYRKDGYYLEDLESIIDDFESLNVKIDSDSVVSTDILEKIINDRKKIVLSYNDENDKMIYSWFVDGNKINDTQNFVTSVSYISEYKKDIDILTNYADGLYLSIKNDNTNNGLILKTYVNDKFDNGKNVKLYCYNNKNNNLDLISDEISVESNYIEFEVGDCSNYFVTMSNIMVSSSEYDSFNIFLVICIIFIIICCFLLFFIIKRNKKSDDFVNADDLNKDDNLNNYDKPKENLAPNGVNLNNNFFNNN